MAKTRLAAPAPAARPRPELPPRLPSSGSALKVGDPLRCLCGEIHEVEAILGRRPVIACPQVRAGDIVQADGFTAYFADGNLVEIDRRW